MYQILVHNLRLANPITYWTGIAGAAFAVAFLLIGLSRSVEFNGIGLTDFRRRTLITFHFFGCVLFSASLVLLGLDVQRQFQKPTGALLIAGLILLFPVHIYVGLLRRVELSRRNPTV